MQWAASVIPQLQVVTSPGLIEAFFSGTGTSAGWFPAPGYIQAKTAFNFVQKSDKPFQLTFQHTGYASRVSDNSLYQYAYEGIWTITNHANCQTYSTDPNWWTNTETTGMYLTDPISLKSTQAQIGSKWVLVFTSELRYAGIPPASWPGPNVILPTLGYAKIEAYPAHRIIVDSLTISNICTAA